MTIKGCRSIAEYAMLRWMCEHGFADKYFTLEVSGHDGIIRDKAGDTLEITYDGDAMCVYVKD